MEKGVELIPGFPSILLGLGLLASWYGTVAFSGCGPKAAPLVCPAPLRPDIFTVSNLGPLNSKWLLLAVAVLPGRDVGALWWWWWLAKVNQLRLFLLWCWWWLLEEKPLENWRRVIQRPCPSTYHYNSTSKTSIRACVLVFAAEHTFFGLLAAGLCGELAA